MASNSPHGESHDDSHANQDFSSMSPEEQSAFMSNVPPRILDALNSPETVEARRRAEDAGNFVRADLPDRKSLG